MIRLLENYYDQKLLIKQNHPNLPLIIWNYSPRCQYERLWDETTLMCRALVTDQKGNIQVLFAMLDKKEINDIIWKIVEKSNA